MRSLFTQRTTFAAVLGSIALASLMACSSTSLPSLTVATGATEAIAVTGKVNHVWVITLENKNYAQTFGAGTAAPYLATTLAAQGALLQGYYGTGHVSLDNYASMVSGQSGTAQTTSDCTTYADFSATTFQTDANGQVLGNGCVYPAEIKTIVDQMNDKGLTWKGYMEDMGNDPTREASTCGHPALGATDLTQTAEAPSASVPLGDQYAARHNPFMYFHSVIDNVSYCQQHVVPYTSLAADLASVATTPNLSFITPNLCDDGHDGPCVNGQPGGLASINTWLQANIPTIMNSAAYKADGLIIINFDEGNYTLTVSPTGSYVITFPGAVCCGEIAGPNLPAYPISTTTGPYQLVYGSYGGDNTGAVLLSPYIKAGTISATPYNHYSMLRSLEDVWGLPHLGYAQMSGLTPFGTDVFTNIH